MLGVVENFLVRDHEFGCTGQWLTGSKVAIEAWMRAAGNLNSNSVACVEHVSGRPKFDPCSADSVVVWRKVAYV